MVQFSNRRSRRRDERRVGILKAAAQVFRDRGFAAAGMRDIALAADLSPGNLYHYFRGKEELLFFCQDRSVDRLLTGLAEMRRDRRAIPLRLRQLALGHVLCLIDEIEGSTAHFEIDALPRRLRAAIVAKRDRYERGVRSLVAEGISTGELRVADATIATRAFLGALNWTAQWFRPGGPDTAYRVADVVADYAVAGLSPQDARLKPRAPSLKPRAPLDQHDDKHLNQPVRQRGANGGRVRAVQNSARGSA